MSEEQKEKIVESSTPSKTTRTRKARPAAAETAPQPALDEIRYVEHDQKEQPNLVLKEEQPAHAEELKSEPKPVKRLFDKNIVLWSLFGVAICVFLVAAILMIVMFARDSKRTDPTPDPDQPSTITYSDETNNSIRTAVYDLFGVADNSSVSDSEYMKRSLLGVVPAAFEYAQVTPECINKLVEIVPDIREKLDEIDVDWDKLFGIKKEQEVIDVLYDLLDVKALENIFAVIRDLVNETGITTEQFGKILYKAFASQAIVIKDNNSMLLATLTEMQEKTNDEDNDDIYTSMNYFVMSTIALRTPTDIANIFNDSGREEGLVKAFSGFAKFAYDISNFYYDSGIKDFGDVIDGIFTGDVDSATLLESADKIAKSLYALKDPDTGRYVTFSNEFKTALNAAVIYIRSIKTIVTSATTAEAKGVIDYYVDMVTQFVSSIEHIDTYINGTLNIMAKGFEGFTKEVSIVLDNKVATTTVAEAFTENILRIRKVDENSGKAYFVPDFDTCLIAANLLNGALKEADSTFSKNFIKTVVKYVGYMPESVLPPESSTMIESMLTQMQTVISMLSNFSTNVTQKVDGKTVVPIHADPTDAKYAPYLSFSYQETVEDENGNKTTIKHTMTAEAFTEMIKEYINAFLATDTSMINFDKKQLVVLPATYLLVATMTPVTVVTHAVAMPIIMILQKYTELELDSSVYSIKSMLENFVTLYGDQVGDWLDMFISRIDVEEVA